MQVVVRDHFTTIAAPVQCHIDGIPKGSHYVLLKRGVSGFQRTADPLRRRDGSAQEFELFSGVTYLWNKYATRTRAVSM
jgi:hypothetical protein